MCGINYLRSEAKWVFGPLEKKYLVTNFKGSVRMVLAAVLVTS